MVLYPRNGFVTCLHIQLACEPEVSIDRIDDNYRLVIYIGHSHLKKPRKPHQKERIAIRMASFGP